MRERWFDALDNRQFYRKYKGQVCLCKSLRMLILGDWRIKRRQWRKAHQLHSSFVFIYLRKGERKKREGGDLYRSWQFPSFCVYVILIYLWIFFPNDWIKYLTLILNYRWLFPFSVFYSPTHMISTVVDGLYELEAWIIIWRYAIFESSYIIFRKKNQKLVQRFYGMYSIFLSSSF